MERVVIYIPKDFEDTWQRFLDLFVSEQIKKYKAESKNKEQVKKNSKGITNKNYLYRKTKQNTLPPKR